MRNFVAKNDFNRGGAHKSPRDYTRASKQNLMDAAYEELEDSWNDWPDLQEHEDLPLKDPKQWESSNRAAYC